MGNRVASTNPQLAVEYYKVAVKNGYDTEGVRVQLGQLLRGLRRYNESIEQFLIVIRRDKDSLRAHLGLAYTFINSGQYEKALQEFGEVKRLDYDSYESGLFANYIAQCLDALSRYEEALEEYEAALRCHCYGESVDKTIRARILELREKLSSPFNPFDQ
jgi:tetratricopeptide (TPR) repeat protein